MDWVSFWCGFVAAFVISGLFAVGFAFVALHPRKNGQDWWQGNPLSKHEDK